MPSDCLHIVLDILLLMSSHFALTLTELLDMVCVAGDYADCAGLARLRREHGALLCLDEAHATLVCGASGGGAAEAAGVSEEVDLHVGTFSKAFGSHGGFVATSRVMKQLLISRGRAGIYSTALPAPTVAAATAALQHATPELRAQLCANIKTFTSEAGLPSGSRYAKPETRVLRVAPFSWPVQQTPSPPCPIILMACYFLPTLITSHTLKLCPTAISCRSLLVMRRMPLQ